MWPLSPSNELSTLRTQHQPAAIDFRSGLTRWGLRAGQSEPGLIQAADENSRSHTGGLVGSVAQAVQRLEFWAALQRQADSEDKGGPAVSPAGIIVAARSASGRDELHRCTPELPLDAEPPIILGARVHASIIDRR